MNSEDDVEKSQMTIWSIGTKPKDDIGVWMDELKDDKTDPAPIERRKLRPIVELFSGDSYKGITDNIQNVTKVRGAIWRAYDNYCERGYSKNSITGPHCEIGCPKVVFFTKETRYVPFLHPNKYTPGSSNFLAISLPIFLWRVWHLTYL